MQKIRKAAHIVGFGDDATRATPHLADTLRAIAREVFV